MASTFTPLDYTQWFIERRQFVSARVGTAVVGISRVGNDSETAWVEIDNATFTFNQDYVPTARDDGLIVLIVGSQTGSLSLSYYGDTLDLPLYPLDVIRGRYGDDVQWTMTVDTVKRTRVGDPSGDPSKLRNDFTATCVGPYAAALNKTICFGPLPAETPAKRLKRYGVTVVSTIYHATDWDE